MGAAPEHIAGWEAAGLIDAATADRLRAVEPGPTTPSATPDSQGVARSAVSRMFGPGVSIAEVFGYLGGGFLLAGWGSVMGTTASASDDPETILGVLGLVTAAALAGLALRLRRGDERSSRAAGVVFLLSVGFVAGAVAAIVTGAGVEWPVSGVFVSSAAVLAAVVYRLVHPAVLTQVGVLSAVSALAAAALLWLQVTIFPEPSPGQTAAASGTGPDPILLVIASAAWWLLVAIGIGLIGLAEARQAERTGDAAASRRAAITRFWAGLLAVVGLSSAITRSVMTSDFESRRVLEPIVGDIAMLILAAVLLERAFRRDATSYVYAAALALIVALTDFNVSYLSDTTGAALVIEGLILLGVGLAADRLRRRIGHDGTVPPEAPAPPPTGGIGPEPISGPTGTSGATEAAPGA
jgi:hypothetical protein